MKILYVEDDAQLQKAISRFLRIFFNTTDITIVDNANDAIMLLASKAYGLVVSDFDLAQGTTGGQVLEWLKEHDTSMLERFVFLSGNDECKALHPHVIPKPSTADEMREVLHAFL